MQLIFMLIALCFVKSAAYSVATAEFNIQVNIVCIDAIEISSSPPPFVFRDPPAGVPYCEAIDQSTTYAITTNNVGRAIYGSLDRALPPGLFLNVHFAPPKGATCWGAVPLNTANNLLVSGISQTAEGSLAITYIMTATTYLSPVFGSNIITYTIGP